MIDRQYETEKHMKAMIKKLTSILLTIALLFTSFIALGTASVEAKSPSKYTWSEKVAPNYVVSIGKAKVSNKPAAGTIKYSKLDKRGRTGRAVGNITYQMVKDSAGWRESFSEGSDPAGWGYNKMVKIKLYTGNYYSGFLYNRSHLIADSLGGRAVRKNLITGTRMQNVGANDGKGGMAYTERKVVNYLYNHQNATVYYSAKPIYKGKELIPRSVIVDIKSSDGKLNERVIVYNAAKGFKINYKTGRATKNASGSTTVYRAKWGKKYHLDKNCYGLRNAVTIKKTTKAKAKKKGLKPCKICA